MASGWVSWVNIGGFADDSDAPAAAAAVPSAAAYPLLYSPCAKCPAIPIIAADAAGCPGYCCPVQTWEKCGSMPMALGPSMPAGMPIGIGRPMNWAAANCDGLTADGAWFCVDGRLR